jgi:hypothetical protein
MGGDKQPAAPRRNRLDHCLGDLRGRHAVNDDAWRPTTPGNSVVDAGLTIRKHSGDDDSGNGVAGAVMRLPASTPVHAFSLCHV